MYWLYYFTPILPYRWFYLLGIAGLQVISHRFNFMMIQLTEPMRNCFIVIIINVIIFLITFIAGTTFIRWFVCISPEWPFRCCYFACSLLWNIQCKCCGSSFFFWRRGWGEFYVFYYKLIFIHCYTRKQKKIKFKLRTKFNHNKLNLEPSRLIHISTIYYETFWHISNNKGRYFKQGSHFSSCKRPLDAILLLSYLYVHCTVIGKSECKKDFEWHVAVCFIMKKLSVINSLSLSIRCDRLVPRRALIWFDSHKWPLPVSDHWILRFWLITYLWKVKLYQKWKLFLTTPGW